MNSSLSSRKYKPIHRKSISILPLLGLLLLVACTKIENIPSYSTSFSNNYMYISLSIPEGLKGKDIYFVYWLYFDDSISKHIRKVEKDFFGIHVPKNFTKLETYLIVDTFTVSNDRKISSEVNWEIYRDFEPESLEALLKVNPDDPVLLLNAMDILNNQSRYDEVISLSDFALKTLTLEWLYKNFPYMDYRSRNELFLKIFSQIHFQMYIAYRGLGKLKLANEELKIYCKNTPTNDTLCSFTH